MNKHRALSSAFLGRVLAGTAAVLAISFTIFSMTATTSSTPVAAERVSPVSAELASLPTTETAGTIASEPTSESDAPPSTTAAQSPAAPDEAYLADGPTAKPVAWAAKPPTTAATSVPPPAAAEAEPAQPAAELATPTAEPTTPAAEPAPVESSGDWMTDLIPQVDPNGRATWVFQRNGGWGASDGRTVFIDPNVPADKRFSVMVHEYSHILQARVFGSLRNSKAALSPVIGVGASDVTANESTADCMALMQGATWVYYGCQDQLRPAAAAILAGHRP